MSMRIARWGNSLAVRIPRALAEQARLAEGAEVELVVEEGRLSIRPRAQAYDLGELVAAITPENRHEKVDWGEPEGREAW
jgi:antitoxin MazE